MKMLTPLFLLGTLFVIATVSGCTPNPPPPRHSLGTTIRVVHVDTNTAGSDSRSA